MARRSDRASVLTRRRGAMTKRGRRDGHVSCVCPYVSDVVVSWTGGGASRYPRGATRGASAPWLCGYACAVGSTMQGPRWRAFGHVSLASGAGGMRLCH
jgi:hypothetical protein